VVSKCRFVERDYVNTSNALMFRMFGEQILFRFIINHHHYELAIGRHSTGDQQRLTRMS